MSESHPPVISCDCVHEIADHGNFGCMRTIGHSDSLSNLGGIQCRCSWRAEP